MKPWAKEILGELAANGPGYGLTIAERLKLSSWAAMGIYPKLRELTAEGLLSVYESHPMPERGNRPRYYYSITMAGREALDRLKIEDADRLLGEMPPFVGDHNPKFVAAVGVEVAAEALRQGPQEILDAAMVTGAKYWLALIDLWESNPDGDVPADKIWALIQRFKAGLPPEAGAEAVAKRPANFESLSAEQQWEIDKRLGLLDWEGDKT